MNQLDSIRRLYKPIQPTVRIDNNQILYREIQPSKDIQDYIYCYWELESKETLSDSYAYRVVSDGCIDIFFELEQPSKNFIMGFCRKYAEFQLGHSFHYYGIRFLPAALPLLFRQNAKDLSNTSQELVSVLPEFSTWISNLKSRQRQSMHTILNERISEIISNQDVIIDDRFFNALTAILERRGFIDVSKDLSTGLSQRQLRRVFNYYIGTTPKAFANVVRFQHILHAKPSKQSLKQNKIYFDLGFFDQAHFIKSFKSFYGVTPSEAFG